MAFTSYENYGTINGSFGGQIRVFYEEAELTNLAFTTSATYSALYGEGDRTGWFDVDSGSFTPEVTYYASGGVELTPSSGSSMIGVYINEPDDDGITGIGSYYAGNGTRCFYQGSIGAGTHTPYLDGYVFDPVSETATSDIGILSFAGTVGESAPTKAKNPTPEHESTGVDWSDLTLSWEDGGGATSYDVYFGNTILFNEWVYLGNTEDTSIVVPYTITGDNVTVEVRAYAGDPADWINTQIDWNDVLYWRVDAINEHGTTTGDVWNFDPRPAKTSVPSPTNALTDITLDWTDFSWTGAPTATSYDIYCALETPPTTTLINIVNSSAATEISQDDFIDAVFGKVAPYYSLADYSSTYYWRVDSKNLFGVAEGDVWTFDTIVFTPPSAVTYDSGKYYLGFGTDYEKEVYNPNFISTTRQLVAAAENRIWYEDI